MDSILVGALIATVTVAAASDIRSRTIPNRLTVAALGIALLSRMLLGGGSLLEGLLGFGLAVAVLLPLFRAGVVGGGDAKLLMAVGAFLGPAGFLTALLASALAGGVLSLVEAARRGAVLPVLLNTGGLLRYYATFGRSGENVSPAGPATISVPYGVAIAIGSLAAVYIGGGG